MTDLERLKARVKETEFPVGSKIREGNIDVEVVDCITGKPTCSVCILDKICKCDIHCIRSERKDRNSVYFKQTNGN